MSKRIWLGSAFVLCGSGDIMEGVGCCGVYDMSVDILCILLVEGGLKVSLVDVLYYISYVHEGSYQ